MLRSSPRAPKLFAGARVRRARDGARLSQAALARAVGVSPSYLNQIERDQRPLPARLLAPLCEALAVPVAFFDEGDEARVVHDLREASADPLFGAGALPLADALAAARHAPALADRFLALYRAYLVEREAAEIEHGPDGSHHAAAGAGQSYDDVRDWVQAHRNHFDPIDRAAEGLALRLGLGDAPGDRLALLARHLADAHGLAVELDPGLLAQGLFWRLQRSRARIVLAAASSGASQAFWLAHIVGLLEQRRTIDRLVREAGFASDETRALARVSLANYHAGALLMPYGRFLEAARAVRYDIERLGARFGASFEQVCHRLSTMQRPGLAGLPFFFLKTDVAGNVLKRSSATRFQFARFGGPCPLWNVYAAFARPGQIDVQLARTPDEITYLNIARTVGRGGGHHLARPRAVAVVLGCEIEYAPLTVYATGLDLADPAAAVPIGPGCRACERMACRHRAVPPAGRALDVGTAERGVVPYRIR